MQKIRIDFDNPGLPQHISAVENDSQSRFFQAMLYENGKAYTAPEGAAYSIMYRGFGPQNQGWYDTINDGAGKRAACAVSGNVVTCEIARQALQVPGHVSIVLCVTTGKGYMLKSWPIECDCKNDRYDSTVEIQSFFYVTQISNESWTQAIQAVEELKNTIDPTLSLSGKAADAKATGEIANNLSELQDTFKIVAKIKWNICDPAKIETGYAWVDFGDGKYASENGRTIAIPVNTNTIYSSSAFDKIFSYFATTIDDNVTNRKLLTDYDAGKSGALEAFTPEADGYLLLTIEPKNTNTFMVVNDSILPSAYKPYGTPYDIILCGTSYMNYVKGEHIENLVTTANATADKVWVKYGDGFYDAKDHYAFNPVRVKQGKKYYTLKFYNGFSFFAPTQNGITDRVSLGDYIEGVEKQNEEITLNGFNPPSDGYLFLSSNPSSSPTTQSILTCNSGALTSYYPYGEIIDIKVRGKSIVNQRDTVIEVAKDGTSTYNTLKSAIEYTYTRSNVTIHVKSGTYDLIEEFGEDYFNNLPASQNAGLKLFNNVYLIFDSDTLVTCHYKGDNENVLRDFSPFNSNTKFSTQDAHYNLGFTIENMTLKCSRVRYAFHDECIGQEEPYHNIFKNCKMTKDNTENAIFNNPSVLGGGLGNNGYIEIENCYFDGKANDKDENRTIASYHGAHSADAKSCIYMNNCYFKDNTSFRLGYMGTSTKMTIAQISGCSFGYAPFVSAETDDAKIVNMEIIAWNNEIRNQKSLGI